MAELDKLLCADPEPHEAHDYPLTDSEWVGDPVWHCPGVAEALPELSQAQWLPGTSAAGFRDGLRTTFLVTGMPVFMFGVVLHMWGPWLMIFFALLLASMITLDVVQRARRLRAYREQQGELE